MQQYLALLQQVLNHGCKKSDRTGVGTLSVFGHQMRFDLGLGFPLVTTKKLHLKAILHELLWFLRGDTNIRYLQEHGVSIWDEWATENGDLGPIYGAQWRAWKSPDGTTLDQIQILLENIKKKPHSRRHIVSAWNPTDLPDETLKPQDNVQQGRMALAPCHTFFQFNVADNRLSCMLTQRSADCFLGVPYNIASYALLTHMVAQQCDLEVGELIWSGGDVHIYLNHLEHVRTQLARQPYVLPQLQLKRKPESIFEYAYEDFELLNYRFHPAIKAAIAV